MFKQLCINVIIVYSINCSGENNKALLYKTNKINAPIIAGRGGKIRNLYRKSGFIQYTYNYIYRHLRADLFFYQMGITLT
ncbi:hypothetical protein HYN43_023750 [Mucilaginibacter celer]|uniref:Uncharacterized protein n=1 Tax=Mucilaginibacter celer TaxID=2305508 RepID=A0A494W2Y9_9SPHI|nr:hypothetical protein HYN43_023750 [Mucilaginibacter celer]